MTHLIKICQLLYSGRCLLAHFSQIITKLFVKKITLLNVLFFQKYSKENSWEAETPRRSATYHTIGLQSTKRTIIPFSWW